MIAYQFGDVEVSLRLLVQQILLFVKLRQITSDVILLCSVYEFDA